MIKSLEKPAGEYKSYYCKFVMKDHLLNSLYNGLYFLFLLIS